MKRIVGATFFVATGAQVFLSACGSPPAPTPPSAPPAPAPVPAPSQGGPTTTPPSPGEGGTVTSSCTVHGTVTTVEGDPVHQLVVPREDVIAGVPRSYHIQGGRDHDHIVTISAQAFATLQQGQSLRMPSSQSIGSVVSHFHFVDVACASA